MEILRLFSPQRTELGVLEAAELLQRPKSTASRWLKGMEEAGFLDRDVESGRYRLSLSLAALGELARQATSLQRVARPILEEMVERVGETTNLVILDGTAAVNVEVVRSSRPIQHVGILGRRLPLHATAAGKVLLTHASPETRERFLARSLPSFTPWTVTDRAQLTQELTEIEAAGVATAWRELEEDLVAASAPVRDHRGRVVAAVTTSAPLSRTSRAALDGLARQVREAALRVSQALGYRSATAPDG